MLTKPNHLYANIAVLNRSGEIVDVNMGWRLFGRENGLADPKSCVGSNYLDVCRNSDVEPEFLAELSDLLARRRTTLARYYPCHVPNGRKRWFVVIGTRHDDVVSLAHVDLTPLTTAAFIANMDEEHPEGSHSAMHF